MDEPRFCNNLRLQIAIGKPLNLCFFCLIYFCCDQKQEMPTKIGRQLLFENLLIGLQNSLVDAFVQIAEVFWRQRDQLTDRCAL